MSDDEVRNYVEKHAPELDPDEVARFIAENEKPTSEPGTPLEWATALLRRRNAGRDEEGPSIDVVAEEMRRHDERQE
jgi:hypothetical protein